MRKIIKNSFEEYIRLNQTIDANLKSVVLRHERSRIFLENLDIEIKKINILRFKKGKPPIEDHRIKDLIYTMTDVYIGTIKSESRQRSESILAKISRQEEIKKKQDMDNTINGNPTGDFAEFIGARNVKEESN